MLQEKHTGVQLQDRQKMRRVMCSSAVWTKMNIDRRFKRRKRINGTFKKLMKRNKSDLRHVFIICQRSLSLQGRRYSRHNIEQDFIFFLHNQLHTFLAHYCVHNDGQCLFPCYGKHIWGYGSYSYNIGTGTLLAVAATFKIIPEL